MLYVLSALSLAAPAPKVNNLGGGDTGRAPDWSVIPHGAAYWMGRHEMGGVALKPKASAKSHSKNSSNVVVLTQYDPTTYPGTTCETWCGGDVVIDVQAAKAKGRATFPPNNIADEVEKCSWDNMCAGCDFCKVDANEEASCMEFCALLATPGVGADVAPWKTQTLPWGTICAWGGCHGCTSCPVAPKALAIHTADEENANTNGQFFYVTGGVSTDLDALIAYSNDKERGQIDTYSVPNADSGVFALQAATDDGWKIDSITYGGLPVDMASCNGGSVWMDNPCVAPGYGSTPTPCMTELTIDTTSMTVTNCPHMMTATTATDNDANSDGGINYISGSDGSVTDLDIFDFNNREKGQTDTYFIPLVSESFQLEATGTDGWSFDALSYDGSAVDMSSCPHGKLWLDKPCTQSMYGDYACLESVTVNVQILKVTDCPKSIEFHTCDVSYGGSNRALSMTYTDVDGSVSPSVDVTQGTRNRNEANTYVFTLPDNVEQMTSLTLNTEGTDGWCVDAITVNGVTMDMSNFRGGGLWLDVCDGNGYGNYDCQGRSLMLDLTTGVAGGSPGSKKV